MAIVLTVMFQESTHNDLFSSFSPTMNDQADRIGPRDYASAKSMNTPVRKA